MVSFSQGKDGDETPHQSEPAEPAFSRFFQTKPPQTVGNCYILLGGELLTNRLGGLVRPSYVCGQIAPTKILLKSSGFLFTHLNDPWDEPPS